MQFVEIPITFSRLDQNSKLGNMEWQVEDKLQLETMLKVSKVSGVDSFCSHNFVR